jgi:hypothetical protein
MSSKISSTIAGEDEGPHPILAILLIAMDPLGGYVFARMAANQGDLRTPLALYTKAH